MDSSFSFEEEGDQYIIDTSSNNNCKAIVASQIQYGDYIILSDSEVIQVDSVRRTTKSRSQKNEMNIQGRNLMKNSVFVQYKFSTNRNLRIIKNAQIKDFRIVCFEPEEELIYVHGNRGVQQVKISNKKDEFDVVSPNLNKIIARCLFYDGQYQLLGFFADSSKQE
ncbi:hypothetical protein ABPG72_010873 [Tetrahymena utriculariae]